VLDERTLVLERVTLAQMVELVVQVLVDLAGGAVLDEQTAEDTQAAHPEDLTVPFLSHKYPTPPSQTPKMCNLRGHPSIRRTLPLTETPVPTDPPRGRQLPRAAPRVHGDGLADDEAIADELADGLAGIGVADLGDFVGVKPAVGVLG
jgi:hypothetical protein